MVYEFATRTTVCNNWLGTTLRSCTSNLGRLTYQEVLHDNRRSVPRSRETLFYPKGTAAVKAIVLCMLSCKGDHVAFRPLLHERSYIICLQSTVIASRASPPLLEQRFEESWTHVARQYIVRRAHPPTILNRFECRGSADSRGSGNVRQGFSPLGI